MWTLPGLIDEIAADFTERCRVASGLGLKYVELRSAGDVNILDLEIAQLTMMRKVPADYGLEGLRVSWRPDWCRASALRSVRS